MNGIIAINIYDTQHALQTRSCSSSPHKHLAPDISSPLPQHSSQLVFICLLTFFLFILVIVSHILDHTIWRDARFVATSLLPGLPKNHSLASPLLLLAFAFPLTG